MSILFQTGIISGLIQGIYDGDMTCQQLTSYGDIGLGTFNGLDGEMVAVDNQYYRIDQAGNATLADPNQYLPFAVVTHFKPEHIFPVTTPCSLNQLNEIIAKQLKTLNIFYMIRIDAEIEWIKMRSEACQTQPYQPLEIALLKAQKIFERHKLSGTLVTTYAPPYSAAMSIPDFHHHFINAERTQGGHVFDALIQQATVMIAPFRTIQLALTNTSDFDRASLTVDTATILKKTE